MGSGKTTLFETIKSKCPEILCLDLDDLIKDKLAEDQETLGDAIRRVGWEQFRETEENLLCLRWLNSVIFNLLFMMTVSVIA